MNLTHYWTKQKLHKPEDGAGNGTPAAVEPASPSPAPAAEPAPASAAATATPSYDWMPEEYRKDGTPDLTGFGEHYATLAKAAAERAALIPSSADEYEIALPADLDFKDLGLPENFGFALKTEDPAFAPIFTGLKAALHEIGAPKDASAKLLGLMARYQATEMQQRIQEHQRAFEAEGAKLGANAATRIAELGRALDTRLTAEQAAALKPMTESAAAVMALESLLSARGMLAGAPAAPAANAVEQDLKAYYSNPKR